MLAAKSNESIVSHCVFEVPLLWIAYDAKVTPRFAGEGSIVVNEARSLIGMQCPTCLLTILGHLCDKIFVFCSLVGRSFVQCILLEGDVIRYPQKFLVIVPKVQLKEAVDLLDVVEINCPQVAICSLVWEGVQLYNI